MSNTLNTHHQDWVEEQVRRSWEQSFETNSVLFDLDEVPPHPDIEAALRASQEALTRNQIDFMMEADEGVRPPFSFQSRLTAPGERAVELIPLLIGNDSGISTRYHPSHSAAASPTWYWELGQGGLYEPTHHESLPLAALVSEFRRALPSGMRGTDLFSWATRIAVGLRNATCIDQPVNLSLPELSSNNGSYTVLDEEGGVLVGGTHFYRRPDGTLNYTPVVRDFISDDIELSSPALSFRMTVGGPMGY